MLKNALWMPLDFEGIQLFTWSSSWSDEYYFDGIQSEHKNTAAEDDNVTDAWN